MSELVTNSDLHARIHPVRQITLSGAASAAMAKQGQFQALAADTPIIDVTTPALAAGDIRVRLKPASVRGGPDKLSLVKFWLTPSLGDVTATINGGNGSVRFQSSATGATLVVIEPKVGDGAIDVTFNLTNGAGTTAVMWAEHRNYSSKPETITSAN